MCDVVLVVVVALPFRPPLSSSQPSRFRKADRFRPVTGLKTELSRIDKRSVVAPRCGGWGLGCSWGTSIPMCSGQQALRRTSRRAEGNELGWQPHHRQFKLCAEGIDNLIHQPDSAAAGGAATRCGATHPGQTPGASVLPRAPTVHRSLAACHSACAPSSSSCGARHPAR